MSTKLRTTYPKFRSRRPPDDVQMSFDVKSWVWVCNPIEWTEEYIEDLRYYILVETLHLLGDGRASAKAVKEAWEWVLSDAIEPFSFRVCCEENGYRHTLLREGLLELHRLQEKKGGKVKVDVQQLLDQLKAA